MGDVSRPFWLFMLFSSVARKPLNGSSGLFRDGVRGSTVFNALTIALMPLLWVVFATIAAMEIMYYYVIGRRHARSPGMRLRSDLSGEQPVATFDPDDANLDWARIQRDYIDRGVPFVLRRVGGAPLSTVVPPASAVAEAFAAGRIRVAALPFLGAIDGLDELVGRLFPWSPRAYWPFWFLGRYSQGKAHIDLGPHTINCYFLRTGVKDVVLVPPEVTKHVALCTGCDGLYVDGSESEGREYLAALPYYHRLDLQPQSLLVFNNASCIHQFRNVQDASGHWPEALSIRVKHCASAEVRIWQHLVGDLAMCKRFSGVGVSQVLRAPPEDRDPKYL